MFVTEIEKPFVFHYSEQNPMFQLHPYRQNREKEANRIKNVLPFAFLKEAWDQKIAITVNGGNVYQCHQYAVNNTETKVVELIIAVEKYCEISKQPEQELNNSKVYFVHADTT